MITLGRMLKGLKLCLLLNIDLPLEFDTHDCKEHKILATKLLEKFDSEFCERF